MTNITIPNSVVSIGDYAFRDCSKLTSVIIGNSVTTIGEEAFYGCDGLTSVTFGNSVTTIGDWAFWGCSGLKSIYASSAQAPTCISNVFYGVDRKSCTLYVPENPTDALSKYSNTQPWNGFVNIETFKPKGADTDALKNKLDVNDDGVVNSTDIVRIYNYIITGK